MGRSRREVLQSFDFEVKRVSVYRRDVGSI
jgi:hypothetical protein